MSMLRATGLCLRIGDFALRDVSLEVQPEEYFVLMGPTGSGKSLLAKCLCGLIRPAGGSIRLGGRDISRLEPRLRQIGYVPQDCGLFPHTNVAKNLTFPCRLERRPRRLLQPWGRRSHAEALESLAPLIKMLALEPLLGRRPSTLSGGERQKVAVARALARGPKLLILDEPVSALDEPTRREVCEQLCRIRERIHVPILHICHSVAEAKLVSDRMGVLLDGRLIQAAPLAELIRNPAHPAVTRLLGA